VNNNTAEMQLKVLEILQPEIQKLKNFMAFQVFVHLLLSFLFTSARSKHNAGYHASGQT